MFIIWELFFYDIFLRLQINFHAVKQAIGLDASIRVFWCLEYYYVTSNDCSIEMQGNTSQPADQRRFFSTVMPAVWNPLFMLSNMGNFQKLNASINKLGANIKKSI